MNKAGAMLQGHSNYSTNLSKVSKVRVLIMAGERGLESGFISPESVSVPRMRAAAHLSEPPGIIQSHYVVILTNKSLKCRSQPSGSEYDVCRNVKTCESGTGSFDIL